jgi:hypothetical protein
VQRDDRDVSVLVERDHDPLRAAPPPDGNANWPRRSVPAPRRVSSTRGRRQRRTRAQTLYRETNAAGQKRRVGVRPETGDVA